MSQKSQGATTIDGSYHFGGIKIKTAEYIPIAFSDHHAHLVRIQTPNPLLCPSRPKKGGFFRINAEVVRYSSFRRQLEEALMTWEEVRSYGADILLWWENIIKPGIRKLASKRGREIKKGVKEELNLLRLRQIYLNRKISICQSWHLPDLRNIHEMINRWYEKES